MGRKLLLAVIAALFIVNCHAQDAAQNTVQPAGSVWSAGFNYYVGVQANQLLNAIINLNVNSTPVSNPYLIIASINSRKNGWGVEGGVGFNYEDITDQLTPSAGETKINNSFYRVGICRKVMVGKRFELGYGLDYVGNYQLNQTFTSSVTADEIIFGAQDSTSATSTNKTTSTGWGMQVTLGFYITRKIMLSTEATYYYMTSAIKQNVTATDYFTDANEPTLNSTTLSASNTSTVNKTITFSLPVALFLVIKI